MDVTGALSDLTDVSTHVEAAVVVESATGSVVSSTLPDVTRAGELADAARRLLEEASTVRRASRALDAAAVTRAGALVVARDDDLFVGAVTQPEPPVRLVLHDLRTCLRAVRAAQRDSPLSRGGEDLGATD